MDWLWRPYIARGAITLLDGDPGLGKSTLALDLTARVSRGWSMPPGGGSVSGKPAGVVILSAEDDPRRVIRPRLDAAGADLDRIGVVHGVTEGQAERPIRFPDDLPLIEPAASEISADLIIVDPIMAFLAGSVDAHRDSDIRRVLHDLKRFAESSGAAVLVLRHLNKLNAGPSIYRGGGSIGIIGAARSGLLVGRDPKDPDIRVLAGVKNNLGPLPQSLAFTVEPAGESSRIGWIGPVALDADDVVTNAGSAKGKLEQCCEALANMLTGCSHAAGEAEKALVGAGFSASTIRRAKDKLSVVSFRADFADGEWFWRLPAAGEDAQAPQQTDK